MSNHTVSSRMLGPEHMAYIRYNTKQLGKVIDWLCELSAEDDKWSIDLWTKPFEIYSIKFKNPRHRVLFELRFAGEIDFIELTDSLT